MKTSARNQSPGAVKQVGKGPVATGVSLAVARGVDVVAVIGTVSAEALRLVAGKRGHAPVKASSVLVAID